MFVCRYCFYRGTTKHYTNEISHYIVCVENGKHLHVFIVLKLLKYHKI